eukprot:2156069-Alexandrium_andersonii.AAC.1
MAGSLEEDLTHILSEAGELHAKEDDEDPAGAGEDAPEESSAGGSTKGFDPAVDAEYVGKLTLCCARTCKLRARQSNEVNPSAYGHYARNVQFPTWPWHQGPYSQPKGRVCAICKLTFVFGKFGSDFK